MDPWTYKHQPKTIDQFIGNRNKVAVIESWLKNFKTNDKKILLISGASGVGKTALAHLIFKKYNYNVIEINSSNTRGIKQMRDILGKALNFQSVLDMFCHGNSPNGILMDELDTFASGTDKGGMGEFIAILKEKRTKDKQLHIQNPIICTYSNFNDKKLNELRTMSFEIRLNTPSEAEMFQLCETLTKREKMRLSPELKKQVVENANFDFRRLTNILYDIYINFGCDCQKVEEDKVAEIIKSFIKKDVDPQIFDSTYNILNQEMDDDEILTYYKTDTLLFPMMIHENFIEHITNKDFGEDEEREKQLILAVADKIIETDIYQTNVYQKQTWEYSDNIGLILGKYVNQVAKYKNKLSRMRVDYTTLLNRISFYHTNKKMINTLETKLNLDMKFEDIIYLSEILITLIFVRQDIADATKIMKQYGLTLEMLDIMIRINKLINSEMNRKLTVKMKNDIKTALVSD